MCLLGTYIYENVILETEDDVNAQMGSQRIRYPSQKILHTTSSEYESVNSSETLTLDREKKVRVD